VAVFLPKNSFVGKLDGPSVTMWHFGTKTPSRNLFDENINNSYCCIFVKLVPQTG
jgi:hypothetical protein